MFHTGAQLMNGISMLSCTISRMPGCHVMIQHNLIKAALSAEKIQVHRTRGPWALISSLVKVIYCLSKLLL